jgi:hypothetical protein
MTSRIALIVAENFPNLRQMLLSQDGDGGSLIEKARGPVEGANNER